MKWPVDDRLLTRRELNRALLERQLLLRRHRLRVPEAISRVAALQAQYSPSPYIGLWSRVEGFEKERLTAALEGRSVVKATLMRGTLHLVSGDDYPAFAGAWHAMRMAEVRTRFGRIGLDPERIAERLLAFAAEQPRSGPELRAFTARELEDLPVPAPYVEWVRRAVAPLVHVPPSGTWRFHATARMVPGEPWLGRPLLPEPDGTRILVERYLAALGPASRDDIAQWSYLPLRQIDDALDALQPLTVYRDEQDRIVFDLPGAPLPAPDTPAPVRFLPKWDGAVLSGRERTRIVPAEYMPTIVRPKNADVLATFLVDGFVAGAWRAERTREAATLEVQPFERLAEATSAEVTEEGGRLLRFLEPDAADHRVKWGGPPEPA